MPIPASEMSLRIYYTFAIFIYKSLIYKGFLGAWLSVNQRLCGQNLGQCVCLIFISHDTFCYTVDGWEQVHKSISIMRTLLRFSNNFSHIYRGKW